MDRIDLHESSVKGKMVRQRRLSNSKGTIEGREVLVPSNPS